MLPEIFYMQNILENLSYRSALKESQGDVLFNNSSKGFESMRYMVTDALKNF
jgi:hypothetical protein